MSKQETYTIEVGGKKGVIVKPTFSQKSSAMASMYTADGNINMADSGRVLLNLCWKEGDMDILNNDDLAFDASIKLWEEFLSTIGGAELKKN
jgi:hypothetical protein